MSSFVAFLHHTAAFVLVSALAVEFVLVRGQLSLSTARSLQRADAVFGAAAGLILIVGLLRVFYFEKGASYYFHSAPFLAKLTLFIAVGLLSIYPTKQFLSWRGDVKAGVVPHVEPARMRVIRSIIHWELACVLVLLLCAALMARGVGHLGS